MNTYLVFSDAAKYANIARSLINGLGYNSSFSFFGGVPTTLPFMPFSIAAFFRIFGVGDFAVIATSFFYFILTLIFAYFLAKKVFKSNLVGTLSILAIGFNNDLIHYATSGASESPFIFEIVAASYFASIRKKWASVVTVLFLILMYFTRPQAFIYIAGFILFWLLLNFKPKVAAIYFVVTLIVGFLVDRFVLLPLSGKYFFYTITGRGINAITQYLPGAASSDILRGGVQEVNILAIGKKIFYNVYNFYKLLPSIASPYMWGLFVIGLFRWKKDTVYNAFKTSAIFMVFATFAVAALTIPLYRYIHPIIPFVYIFAIDTLIWIVGKISDNKRFVILASSFLILFFVVGQTLGVIFLDSRFEKNTHNVGKPPVYFVLSSILKDNTMSDQIIVTNLDTWGSWYGERKTVWYPLKPNMLIPPEGQKNPFDAIFLTSYLMDDENYYMGPEWRQVFENPQNPTKWNEFIAENYKFTGEFEVPAEETYEKQEGRVILLIRK